MPATLYISPQGRDTWSGRLPEPHASGADGPLASLEAARLRLRQAPAPGADIVLRAGDYPLARGLAFGPEDSGSAGAPITYRAAPGEKVRLLGGRLLSAFAPVQDPRVRQRLAPQAREQVLQCDLRAAGLDDLGSFVSRGFGRPHAPAHAELFFAGERLQLARWPDAGEWARIQAPAAPDPQGDGHGGELGLLQDGFLFAGERPSRWRDLSKVWLHGYWAWDWANSCEQLASWDAEKGHIQTRPPHGLYGFRAGQRFYFFNVLEELDRPGEYWIDAESGLAYFWPPAPPHAAEVAASLVADPLLRVSGASHLRFAGLELAYGRGDGALIEGGEGVVVEDCRLRCLGGRGIVIEGGRRHQVLSCEVARTGDGGAYLRGGDRLSLEPSQHRIEHTRIHHFGEWSRCYQPGVRLEGVGQRVSRCEIHDGPHAAVLLAGNEHIVELTRIHRVCQESGDVGAFYMGRDWSERGNIVRHNFFHDTRGIGMGSMAVYLDDCASGTTVFGNVFCGCTRAVFIGGGRNNRVENNIFVDCEPAVQIDGRGLDPGPVWRDMVHKTMKERLQAVCHRQPPYAHRYPDLAELDPYYAEGAGVPPAGNLVVRNICRGGEWLKIHWHADARIVAVQNNMVGEDPLFVDPEAMDYQLRVDSPAYEIGFKRIPFERIGPRARHSSPQEEHSPHA